MTMHERSLPAGPFQQAFRMMSIPAQLFAVVILPLGLLGLIQFTTQFLVSVLLVQGPTPVQGVLGYFGFWFQADPPARYGVAGAAVLHWVIAVTLLGGGIALLIWVLRVRDRRHRDPQRRHGLAGKDDAQAELGTQQLLDRAADLLPRTAEAGQALSPDMLGFLVGVYRGLPVWTRVEDPIILVGPSRSGKGLFLLLWWILSAPGAVITTSSKLDNAKLTMMARLRKWPGTRVWIFAPGIAGGKHYGHVLRWDPVDGCIDEDTLVRRIKALIPSDAFGGSTTNGGHWDTLGQQLAAHLFHAAACGGLDVDRIWEWVSSPVAAREAVRLIRDHPHGLKEHADHLETVIDTPPEQRAAQWGVLPTVLAFLESRSAREWMKPGEGDTFDPVRFVLKRETLYLVGDKMASAGYVRILDGLLAELDYVTKGLADVSPGGRLDPPVTYLLDEAGNIEYQGLYELITAGGGRGRIAVAVFQSKSQLQQYGGKEAEDVLWDAATCKIVLPGGGSPEKLREISQLIGTTWVERVSHTIGQGPTSASLSAERVDIFTESEVRTLGDPDHKYAIVFYRSLEPVVPLLTPFFAHPDFDQFAQDARDLTAKARPQSEFAQAMDDFYGSVVDPGQADEFLKELATLEAQARKVAG